MDFSSFPSLAELKARAQVWAQENGLGQYTGHAGSRGKGNDEDAALGWQREAFSSRIDMVGLNLNLPVRPVLLSGADGMSGAKEVLREAYRNEPLFKWLLGDVRKDNKGKAKENMLLEWLIDWRISSCWRYSHCLAIPQRSRPGQGATFADDGTQEIDMRGCAIVTYPGRCVAAVLVRAHTHSACIMRSLRYVHVSMHVHAFMRACVHAHAYLHTLHVHAFFNHTSHTCAYNMHHQPSNADPPTASKT